MQRFSFLERSFKILMLSLIPGESIFKRDTEISRMETKELHNLATKKSVCVWTGGGGQIFGKTTMLRIWKLAKGRWQFGRLLSRALTPQRQQQNSVACFPVLLSSLPDTKRTVIPSAHSIHENQNLAAREGWFDLKHGVEKSPCLGTFSDRTASWRQTKLTLQLSWHHGPG